MTGCAFVFIDTEYCVACSLREGLMPDYRNILNQIRQQFKPVCVFAYAVGAKKKKAKITDFLIHNGVDYVITLEYENSSKTQVVGAAMGLDVQRIMLSDARAQDSEFVFVTADDYMVPVVDHLNNAGYHPVIYYYQTIFSADLADKCRAEKLLMNTLFRKKPDGHEIVS